MPLRLNFEWEEATVSTTLSDPSPLKAASEFACRPCRMQPRQATFYRNLIKLAEQTRSRIIPVSFIKSDGQEKRLDFGCMKLAEHAGFITRLENGPSGVVETIQLAWNPDQPRRRISRNRLR
jgi:hypothetical protein